MNHRPIAFKQTISLEPNKPKGFILNASDADSDELTFTIVGEPVHGIISSLDPSNGAGIYTPSNNLSDIFINGDTFTFKATDKQGLSSNPAIVTLNY